MIIDTNKKSTQNSKQHMQTQSKSQSKSANTK